ncbi:glycosyltransferase family 4 protein [Paenibacillus sp. LHD-117]|uniref:glycosyltransferase family 4 protein n=1 Tax=Paenibacillus sp. LHD-117 TaxID=3071412 RepID=UPI0027DF957B|nr:glycosyltransferase family 4 protein [Paenibacillus sp. LHD-117]MDQ6422466.1 glycosyltransferase family 4 protein [Paenibacillus sp. LHD-117]
MTKVSILTHSFLDGYNRNFSRIFGGGLERYIYDLCGIVKELGGQPIVHQLSFYEPFETTVEGIQVYGHPYELDKQAEGFEKMADQAEGKLIYASFIWHQMQYKPGSIGICHGINWDQPALPNPQKQHVAMSIQNALSQLDRIVSVDSHFLTFCRSACAYTDPEKVILIPNSVDTGYFKPAKKKRASSRLRILYPRRISYERGIIPMMLVTDRLLEKYPGIKVEFAGELIQESHIGDTFAIWRQAHPHKDRILQRSYTFDQIIDAYHGADIAVIPTIFSEGTSYSCLEALSCGLPVVSSNVGGLNDLIIDGYNGKLVVPTEQRLFEAICELVDNKEERRKLSGHARNTAFAFDKSVWTKRWKQVLTHYLA